jgi:FKBP-type peptidyl-prolyl cis-trans isomerase
MRQKDILIGIAVGLAVVTLVGLGIWWGISSQDGPKSSLGAVAESGGSSLNVATASGAQNLGQLGTNSQPATGSSGGTASSASRAPSPDQFAQYEKYKDNKDALFGEIETGNGKELAINKKAAVYYKGWLTNGQLFDQSRTDSSGKLQPFVFTLGAHEVIPGWEQGVNGMKVGGRRLIIVPPAVGYGAQGQGSVPPNAVLVFEVQLLDVQ